MSRADAGARTDDGAWAATLDEMERHLAAVDDALSGRAKYPGGFRTPIPSSALPTAMRSRARRLLERQRDAEAGLRSRLEVLGGFIFGDARDAAETGVSIDIRS